ncbi:MAG: hypothetical protein IT208_11660 [Chthonomonadales bacterium]|nr:hypothetical protein [Chthonomonadales bacterium]
MLAMALSMPPVAAPARPAWVAAPGALAARTSVRFTAALDLPTRPQRALLRVGAQRRYRLYLNGRPAAVGDRTWGDVFDVAPLLRAGPNRAEIRVDCEPVPAPANAWVIVQRDLPGPVDARVLEFETSGSRGGEWLYVECVDADGRASNYWCPETGRADLLLGSDGAARRHRIDLLAERRLPHGVGVACDLTRVVALRIRVDQKATGGHPAGAVRFAGVRLEGPGAPGTAVDLGGADGWRLVAGQGNIRGARVEPAPGGFAVRYDFGPAADARFALDLRALAGGREIGRLVSGAAWSTEAGAAVPVSRPPSDGSVMVEYSPIDVRDLADAGSRPVLLTVDLAFAGGADRVPAGRETPVTARLVAAEAGSARTLRLRVEDWSGALVADLEAPVRWRGPDGDAELRLPPLARGLYRLSARPAARARCAERYAALAVMGPGEARVSALFDTLRPFAAARPGLQGVDLFYADSPALLMGLRDLGVSFLQFHIEPAQLDNGELDEILAFCRATRTRFALNNESSNWGPGAPRADGANPFDAPGGCHRWDIEPAALRRAAATGLFEGVVYDEGEHMQLCRNYYSGLSEPVHRKPYLVETTGMSLPAAYAAFTEAAASVARRNREAGARMLVESVFPVLWHPLARAGVTLCPKLLKEDIHPVVLAMALGAANQYGADLWFSPDLWHTDQLPGHSAHEYGEALRLAHRAGVDNVYTEFVTCLTRYSGAQYEVTAYGATLRDHIRRWLPAHPRAYTFRDYAPEVVIVRFPDSDWGQASGSYWNTLYGAENLRSTPETREWLQVWSLLTGGASQPGAVNTNSGIYDRLSWQFTVPCASTAVYDHRVGRGLSASARLLFLCGIALTDETLVAARERVRAGAVCFAPARLCPSDVCASAAKLPIRVADGRGAWVVVAGFRREDLGPYARLIPAPGRAMRLRFDAKAPHTAAAPDGRER